MGPIPEVQVFFNSGWRITGQRQVLRIDCLPILKPFPILPKNREEQRDVQCSDGDCNQSHEVIFGMFSGQRSTPGNGLSCQPRDCHCRLRKKNSTF